MKLQQMIEAGVRRARMDKIVWYVVVCNGALTLTLAPRGGEMIVHRCHPSD